MRLRHLSTNLFPKKAASHRQLPQLRKFCFDLLEEPSRMPQIRDMQFGKRTRTPDKRIYRGLDIAFVVIAVSARIYKAGEVIGRPGEKTGARKMGPSSPPTPGLLSEGV